MAMDNGMGDRLGALQRMAGGAGPGDALKKMTESPDMGGADLVARVEEASDNPQFVMELEKLLEKFGGGEKPEAEMPPMPPAKETM